MTPFSLPRRMAARIAREARGAGATLVETGGFVLAGGDHEPVLALTGTVDIQRETHLFYVGMQAMVTLFDWATARDMTVVAQWHTHRYEAFLSDTDLEYGFNVPDFHTSVVPHYKTASEEPSDWGWWQYQSQAWVRIPAPALTQETFAVISFEAGNVIEY